MARKRPEYNEYSGINAEEYGSSRWMKKNQIEVTQRALELLESSLFDNQEIDPESTLCLDIGAGTGYSTDQITEYGLKTIAMDLSFDMLQQNENLFKIVADLRQLPFRDSKFNVIISISAFNFASSGAKSLDEKQSLIIKSLNELKRVSTEDVRIAIEFYPEKVDLDLFLSVSKKLDFEGGLMIDKHGKKAEKKFLILKK